MGMIKTGLKILKENGARAFIRTANDKFRIKYRVIRLLLFPIAFPIAIILVAISPWYRVRFLMLSSAIIGHYAHDTEFWLCAFDNAIKNDRKNFYFTVPGYRICNEQLHLMWSRVIPILPFSYLMNEIDIYLMKLSKDYRNDPFKNFFKPPARNSWDAWNLLGKIKAPHISFTKEEEARGKALLEKFNIHEGDRFVCLIGRDSLYLKMHMPMTDYSYNNYRNVDINTYKKAALYLAEKGYYVLRMGKYVQDHFNVDHPKIIDYATSEFRSDFADVYLGAKCFFIITCDTGWDAMGQIFRKPMLVTNLPTFGSLIDPNWDLMILKHASDIRHGKYLTIEEVSKIFSYEKINGARLVPKILREENLVMVDNTEDEILEATEEMLGRLSGTWETSEDDEFLQEKYWRNFKDPGITLRSTTPPDLRVEKLRVPVFDWKNLHDNRTKGCVRLRMGSKFLRKYKSILFNEKIENELNSVV